MEDNSSSDDEVMVELLNSNTAEKKLKLNDGSSQESLKESATSSKADVDSGISADKSESTSSDDRVAGTTIEGPSNEVVTLAPSSSNVRAILLNIRRPRKDRNYRKRKTPDRSSNSNSSQDSDDLSEGEGGVPPTLRQSNDSDTEQSNQEELDRSIVNINDDSEDVDMQSDEYSDDLNSSDGSHIIGNQDSVSDDSDDWSHSDFVDESNENTSKENPPSVLLKTRPKHNYLLLREIINREMGLTSRCGKTVRNDVIFEHKFYGSLHVVYRMKKLHELNKHRGCVNSINFHPEGKLLASGSDDLNVIIWDWARKAALQTIKTGHKSNVFQSKFLHLNARSQLNIVTCARDGQVRLLQCPPSGGSSVARRRLASHSRAAHKLHVLRAEPHVVLSAGEDGVVMQCDVRDHHAKKLFQVKDKDVIIPLYSVHGHPLDCNQLVVAGRDRFVRVFDRRKTSGHCNMYCPNAFQDIVASRKKFRVSLMHLTCAVYNHDGSEILASYNDEDIYLFDTKADVYDKDSTKEGFTHRYSGHKNSATFKGVAFFGPKSEYIVSGSDCSYIYVWEKNSEAIVQWMEGDHNGVVNCIEAHPRSPVLASSGLDKDVKIWLPKGSSDPDYTGLEQVVRQNCISHLRRPLFNDFLPTLYSAWQSGSGATDEDAPNYEFDGNVCTAF